MSALRPRLTYANVMATVAVFVALGGSSYAALKVTGKNVKNSSLTGLDVKNDSLTTKDVKNKSLLSKDFKAGQLAAGPRGATGPAGPKGSTGGTGSPAASLLTGRFDDAPFGTTSTAYVSPSGGSTLDDDPEVSMLSPARTIIARDLFVRADGPASGSTKVTTLAVNGGDTAVTCTITEGNTSCSDTTHAVVIPPGNSISLHYNYNTAGAGGTLADVAFGWRATTP